MFFIFHLFSHWVLYRAGIGDRSIEYGHKLAIFRRGL